VSLRGAPVDYRRAARAGIVSPRTIGAIPLLALLVLSSCGSSPPSRASATATATIRPSVSPITSANTTALPIGRWAAAAAYDETRHNLVLFGGLAGQMFLDDTWTWSGSTWTQRQGLTIGPPARHGAAIAYDEVNRQVILFGGLGSTGPLDDTWAWDGSAWQELHPSHSPSNREGATATYDRARSAIILYGGVNQRTSPPTPINETWSWNGGDWTQLSIPGPGGGLRPQSGFLIGANLVERFGDCSDAHDATVYGFDGGSWVPKTTSGTPPPALCLPSMAGDSNQRAVVLFGGNPATHASPVPADTWVYDGDVWHKPSPAQSPPARDDASMVYDPDHHVMVLFGGQGLNQGQSGALNDTWTWDGSNWSSH